MPTLPELYLMAAVLLATLAYEVWLERQKDDARGQDVPEISRIEVYKGLGRASEYCAMIFVDGAYDARIDASPSFFKITRKSSMQSRLAGVDRLLNGVTIDRLLSHPTAVVNPR